MTYLLLIGSLILILLLGSIYLLLADSASTFPHARVLSVRSVLQVFLALSGTTFLEGSLAAVPIYPDRLCFFLPKTSWLV